MTNLPVVSEGGRSPAPLQKYTSISPAMLRERPTILGYIKVGGFAPGVRWSRGTPSRPFLLPTRYVNPARFEITTREQDVREVSDRSGNKHTLSHGYKRDEDFHKIVGDAPTTLRVRLMFNDVEPNFTAKLGAHNGTEWVCEGNGEEATDIERGVCVCPCPRLSTWKGPPSDYKGPTSKRYKGLKCKPHGRLLVILEDAQVYGGFWALKTGSWESNANLYSQLKMFREQFAGLQGLPLLLNVYAATKQFGEGGKKTTQPIVTLTMPGGFEEAKQLALAGRERAKQLTAGYDPVDVHQMLAEELEEEQALELAEFPQPGQEAPAPAVGPIQTLEQAAAALEQDAEPPVQQAVVVDPEPAEEPQQESPRDQGNRAKMNRRYFAVVGELGWSDFDRKLWQHHVLGKASCSEWDTADYIKAVAAIKAGNTAIPELKVAQPAQPEPVEGGLPPELEGAPDQW